MNNATDSGHVSESLKQDLASFVAANNANRIIPPPNVGVENASGNHLVNGTIGYQPRRGIPGFVEGLLVI